MPCPNCGFVSAPGTMFCGKCGTRLSSAPAQPNPYQPPAPPAGGYIPPQRPAYTPPAAPAQPNPYQPSAASYVSQAPAAPVINTYQSYGASMMQSPYITSASRGSAPVISASRDGAAQYTAVSTNVYSPQARAAAQASESAARKKKSGSVAMTIIAVVILAATAAMVYFSGLLEQSDNSIYVPEASGSVQQSTTKPSQTLPAVSSGDMSGSDVVIVPDEPEDTSSGLPAGLSVNDYASANAFVSAFTEVGLVNINGSLSAKDLMSFAVASLSINSNVYESTDFSYGSENYSYSISDDMVSQHISRYFGENAQIFPAVGDSADGWLYYGDSYYLTELAHSKGFAIITDYKSDGELVTVSFNVYAPNGNDAEYYGMTAKEAEDAGCTVIGSGKATLGKLYRNGRDTYLMQSIETSMK